MSDNFTKLKQILNEGQYKRIHGYLVDGVTANAILTVYNNLNQTNKEKFKKTINEDIKKATSITWKVLG